MRKLATTITVLAGFAAAATTGASASAPAASPQPQCSRSAARGAIAQTPLGRRFIDFVKGESWFIPTLHCAALMGGRATDMVALATCCTASSPTPLFIFRPVRGAWRLTYSTNLKTLITRLQLKARTLRETRPVYRPSDPSCCPSSFTHWTLRWNGRRWVLKRQR